MKRRDSGRIFQKLVSSLDLRSNCNEDEVIFMYLVNISTFTIYLWRWQVKYGILNYLESQMWLNHQKSAIS